MLPSLCARSACAHQKSLKLCKAAQSLHCANGHAIGPGGATSVYVGEHRCPGENGLPSRFVAQQVLWNERTKVRVAMHRAKLMVTPVWQALCLQGCQLLVMWSPLIE
jgi:hypothetical protein